MKNGFKWVGNESGSFAFLLLTAPVFAIQVFSNSNYFLDTFAAILVIVAAAVTTAAKHFYISASTQPN